MRLRIDQGHRTAVDGLIPSKINGIIECISGERFSDKVGEIFGCLVHSNLLS